MECIYRDVWSIHESENLNETKWTERLVVIRSSVDFKGRHRDSSVNQSVLQNLQCHHMSTD